MDKVKTVKTTNTECIKELVLMKFKIIGKL